MNYKEYNKRVKLHPVYNSDKVTIKGMQLYIDNKYHGIFSVIDIHSHAKKVLKEKGKTN
jgi:hypothetical protein